MHTIAYLKNELLHGVKCKDCLYYNRPTEISFEVFNNAQGRSTCFNECPTITLQNSEAFFQHLK